MVARSSAPHAIEGFYASAAEWSGGHGRRRPAEFAALCTIREAPFAHCSQRIVSRQPRVGTRRT
jgi:hypothetical protein